MGKLSVFFAAIIMLFIAGYIFWNGQGDPIVAVIFLLLGILGIIFVLPKKNL